jgi:CDP-diacylglycerol pyrophosphatase
MNWHPFTEEPTEEGQYLVQHFYKSWSGRIFITFEVVDSLEELIGLIDINKKNGNRDNYYQAWMKIEPYEEKDNE